MAAKFSRYVFKRLARYIKRQLSLLPKRLSVRRGGGGRLFTGTGTIILSWAPSMFGVLIRENYRGIPPRNTGLTLTHAGADP